MGVVKYAAEHQGRYAFWISCLPLCWGHDMIPQSPFGTRHSPRILHGWKKRKVPWFKNNEKYETMKMPYCSGVAMCLSVGFLSPLYLSDSPTRYTVNNCPVRLTKSGNPFEGRSVDFPMQLKKPLKNHQCWKLSHISDCDTTFQTEPMSIAVSSLPPSTA